ncbi:MAG: T9SS type A sorting domain-containing protein [Bacteroidetes bacterium]|nr:T9SS type A sorting domain-containing protein [Bacteroidota bacterium]
MKTILSILILNTVLNISLYAQSDSLRDYRWQIGYANVEDHPDYGGIDINFHESPVEFTYVERDLNFNHTNASICNKEGELLFYTNGIDICNRFGDTIPNGTGLNPGVFADDQEEDGYKLSNGAFAIPDPGNEDFYYLIHESFELIELAETYTTTTKLYYTIIDMSTPDGNVISKNNLILVDTFGIGHLSAVRHANGRDWWFLKARYNSNQFHTFLIDPQGIHYSHLQEVAQPIHLIGGVGQAVFSPDGTKYARNDGSFVVGSRSVKLWDFDRCTGDLTDMRKFVIPDTSVGDGIAFSPNSRYLYSTITDSVFQFDTQAANLEAGMQVVAEWDDDYAPYPHVAWFFMMQLAPNNKIYISGLNNSKMLHVIHNPDEAGSACNIEKMGIDLPAFNLNSIPNFPNYRLGALPGSPCDTLGLSVDATEEIQRPKVVTISPNPTNGVINIQCSEPLPDDAKWVLYDYQGREVFRASKSQIEAEIDLQHLADGIYFWKIFAENDNLQTGRLVISR